jgi:hypothetical protein
LLRVIDIEIEAAQSVDAQAQKATLVHRLTGEVKKARMPVSHLRCWNSGKSPVRISSKFVSEVLLRFSEIELVDQEKFAAAALLKLADQKRV